MFILWHKPQKLPANLPYCLEQKCLLAYSPYFEQLEERTADIKDDLTFDWHQTFTAAMKNKGAAGEDVQPRLVGQGRC